MTSPLEIRQNIRSFKNTGSPTIDVIMASVRQYAAQEAQKISDSLTPLLQAAQGQVGNLSAQVSAAQQKTDALQAQLDAALAEDQQDEAEIAAIQAQLADAQQKAADLQTQLAAAQADESGLKTLLDAANGQIVTLEAQVASLQKQLDDCQNPPPPPPPPPHVTTNLGVSASGLDDTGAPHDVVRIYQIGMTKVNSAMTGYPTVPKRLAISDDSKITTAAQLDTALAAIFKKYPDVLVDWVHHNEVSREALDMTQYASDVHAMRLVCDKYPNARMGIDLTQSTIKQGAHVKFKVCAPDLQFIAASCYNPGRNETPIVWDDLSYLDNIMQVCLDWGIMSFGCWEFGNPVDPKDPTKRPSYVVQAVQHMATWCASHSVTFDSFVWWNNTGTSDNRLANDKPKTATALSGALI